MSESASVDEVSHQLLSLKLSQSEDSAAVLPEGWPDDLGVFYTNRLIWESVDPEVKDAYKEDLPSCDYVYIGKISQGQFGLFSRASDDLPAGAWLDEYTGIVEHKKDVTDLKYSVCYVNDYVIDAKTHCNEMRFMRRTKSISLANTRFQYMYIDGRLAIYVEIIKVIQPDEEIIVYEQDNCVNYQIKYVRTPQVNDPGSIIKMQFSDLKKLTYTNKLIWDSLPSIEKLRLQRKNSNLSTLAKVMRVNKEGHPCNGQFGLFAVKKLKKSTYIGEYTGRVLTDADERSRYLVDFSNPYNEKYDKVWVDASKWGNEIRFINDNMGISKNENCQFKRLWVGGRMHVFVQVLKDISAGQEITVSYGDVYWDNIHDNDEQEEEDEDETNQDESKEENNSSESTDINTEI